MTKAKSSTTHSKKAGKGETHPLLKEKPKKQTPESALQAYIVGGCEMVDGVLEKRLKGLLSGEKTAADLAHIFMSLKLAHDRWEQTLKVMGEAVEHLKTKLVPEAMERENVTSFNCSEGYRVTVSTALRCSLKPDQKEAAFTWLRKNKLGDLIIETVNAGTLSAAARKMIEDEGKDLPEAHFNSYYQPNTSLTKIK